MRTAKQESGRVARKAKPKNELNQLLSVSLLILLGLTLGTVGRIWEQAATLGYIFGRTPGIPAAVAFQAPTVIAIPTTLVATTTPLATTAETGATPRARGMPLRAAFYYAWFPEAWTQKGISPFTHWTPTLGRYDTSDSAVIRQHIAAMQYGHIEAGIASWWGQGTPTDRRMPTLLKAAAGTDFRWAIYYEPEGTSNPSPAQLAVDLQYIHDRFSNDPGYLRIDGRFVVFVYADPADSCDMVSRWKQANTANAYVILKVFPNYRTCPIQPDSWHQYAPATAESSQPGMSFSISPGFWLAGQQERLPRDLARWDASVRMMVASNAPLQLITTFNEWGEGTAIEPAQEWSSASGFGAFLDALHTNGEAVPLSDSAGSPSATLTIPIAAAPAPAPATPTAVVASATPSATVRLLTAPASPTAISATPIPPRVGLPLPSLAPGNDPVFAGAGDIACDPADPSYNNGQGGKNNCHERATSDLLLGLQAAGKLTAVFALGDNQYENGDAVKFGSSYDQTWGRLKDVTFPAVGNHEYLTPGASPYFQYFDKIAGASQKGYYSFDLGAWHVVVINSMCSQVGGCSAGSPQNQWLRDDLAQHPNRCTLAYWHHPRFSSGEHGNTDSMQPIWQTLYDYGAAAVLNGHDHDYERFAPQDPTGVSDPAHGIMEFVVGTGGKNHTHLRQLEPNSQVFNDNAFGILKLTLHAKGFDWQFVPEPSKTFVDAGSGVCNPRQP